MTPNQIESTESGDFLVATFKVCGLKFTFNSVC